MNTRSNYWITEKSWRKDIGGKNCFYTRDFNTRHDHYNTGCFSSEMMVEKRALPRAPAIPPCPGKLQTHKSQGRERLKRKEGKILDATGTLQTAAAAASGHKKEARREMSQETKGSRTARGSIPGKTQPLRTCPHSHSDEANTEGRDGETDSIADTV